MKRILVTGGSGFIGSAIVKKLLAIGCEVTILDDNSRGSLERLKKVASKFKFVDGSITDKEAVRSACVDVDSVVHLAYINGTKNFYERPGAVLDVGIRGILNLSDAMSEFNIPELILASSSEVYQQPSVVPTPENIPMIVPELENPRYSYGLGKIVQEFYGFHAMKNLKRFVIFRPHNIYGPDMGNLHVVPQLIEKCRIAKESATSLEIEGDGLQTRSFCFIDDFVDAFELIFTHGKHQNVYNIGTSEEVNIKDLAKLIGKLMHFDGDIKTSVGPSGGTSRRLPDIGKIAHLGFKQKTSLESGLQICVKENK
jgi:nucleoside-diphosphate-sugar epimerase